MRRFVPWVLFLAARDGQSADVVALSRTQAVPPVVYRVDDAKGIPPGTCDEALGKVPEPKPEVPREVRPAESTGQPDLTLLPQITLEGLAFDRKNLPGGDPASLPLRRLEGSPAVLAKVGAVLVKANAKQRVRISVFGASHTGGDFLTGHMRRLLQRRYGDIGHGFIFPAAIYDGYRGSDVNLCRSEDWFADYVGKRDGRADGLYGFAGASVSSNDPGQFGWIETTHSNPEGQKASSYDLFSLGQPAGGTLFVQVDEAAPVQISTKADTPRLLRHRFEVADGGHRFAVRPAGDGEVRLFGVSVERPGPGVIVDAMGVRGRTAKTWLQWDRTLADQGLATLKPDLVILAYGTNEGNDLKYTMEQYATDLDLVLKDLKKGAPDAACLLMGPSDRGVKIDDATFGVWDRTEPVAKVQREAAALHGCAFWDWQAATGGPGSMIGWFHQDPPLASGDLIHFTQKGYERVAEQFLAALDAAAMESMGR